MPGKPRKQIFFSYKMVHLNFSPKCVSFPIRLHLCYELYVSADALINVQ